MTLSRLALGLAFAAGVYQTADATVISSVHTYVDGQTGFIENNTVTPNDPAATRVHAWGSTLYNGSGFANAGTGPLPCGGPTQPLCFSVGNSNAAAFATSQASGATGSLHVSASANAQPTTGRNVGSATGTAGLRDRITFQGAPLINIDLDLSRSAVGDHWHHGLVFTLDLCFQGGCAVSSLEVLSLSLSSSDGPFGSNSVYTLRYYDANGNFIVTQDSTIPSETDITLDLSFLGDPEFEIVADLSVFAEVEDGASSIHADESLYLKMDNVISDNGYTYAGRLIEEPPPTGIPAPNSLILLASGLGAFTWSRRRSQAA
jgi:hypothetical protein